MFKEYINRINSNTKLEILGQKYDVLSKTSYYTKNNPEVSYYKMVLTNHKILLILLEDDMAYIGEVNNNLGYRKSDNETITLDNSVYKKIVEDYQYVNKIEFGDKSNVEFECDYTDYESEDGTTVISVATLRPENVPDDTIVKKLNIEDIKFI